MTQKIKLATLCSGIIIAVLLMFWASTVLMPWNYQDSAPLPDVTEDHAALVSSESNFVPYALEINIIENHENELVFDLVMEDFIESFNSFYGSDYLGMQSSWRVLIYDSSVHSDHETAVYEYSLDENIWSMPTISVYTPANGDYIQAVTVNFDEHGYSDTFYSHFEKLCYHTLKVFFPDMEDDAIHSLYKQANELGNLNVFLNEDGYEKGCVPCVIYHKDGIGVYPYFAIGEWTHLCIIPVNQELIDEYAALGTEIREISEINNLP